MWHGRGEERGLQQDGVHQLRRLLLLQVRGQHPRLRALQVCGLCWHVLLLGGRASIYSPKARSAFGIRCGLTFWMKLAGPP